MRPAAGRGEHMPHPLDYRARAARAAGRTGPCAELIWWNASGRGAGRAGRGFRMLRPAGGVGQAVALMRPGGRLMLIGIPETERMGLVIDQARRAEVRVLNVRRQCGCADDTLKLMAAGLLDVDFMVRPLSHAAHGGGVHGVRLP